MIILARLTITIALAYALTLIAFITFSRAGEGDWSCGKYFDVHTASDWAKITVVAPPRKRQMRYTVELKAEILKVEDSDEEFVRITPMFKGKTM
jgi:hypothetical protein